MYTRLHFVAGIVVLNEFAIEMDNVCVLFDVVVRSHQEALECDEI